MRKTTVHFSANFSRFLILLLVIGMLATCFTGCFTYDPLGKENEGNNGPAFDPDGDDEPDQPTEPTDSMQSTDATTGTEPVGGTENTAPTQPPATEPTQPATQPTEPPTQPTQPTQPPVYADPIARGMVTATELNIRKGPGKNYDVAGAYKFNARVTIYARNGKWGQTKDGWISMDYVYVDGTVGNMKNEKGTLTGDYVNVRSGPGTQYGVLRSTRKGDRVTVLHKVTINGKGWYCIADGWISADYVLLDKDKTADTETDTGTGTDTDTDTSESANSLASAIIGTWQYSEESHGTYEKDGETLEADGILVLYVRFNSDGTWQSQEEFKVDSITVKTETESGTYTINNNLLTIGSDEGVTFSINGNTLTIDGVAELTKVS